MSHALRIPSVVSILALSLAAFGAQAQMGGNMMQRVDTDKDGKISAEEFKVGRQPMFKRLDADTNGTLSLTEIDAMSQGRPNGGGNGGGGNMMQKRLEALKAADTDGNKSVSQAEYDGLVTSEFKMLDTNADGFISTDELQAMMR